jgi:hypothetical protein
MHQVLYRGIRAFHGVMSAFLNIPYSPISERTKVMINKTHPMLMDPNAIINKSKKLLIPEFLKCGQMYRFKSLYEKPAENTYH